MRTGTGGLLSRAALSLAGAAAGLAALGALTTGCSKDWMYPNPDVVAERDAPGKSRAGARHALLSTLMQSTVGVRRVRLVPGGFCLTLGEKSATFRLQDVHQLVVRNAGYGYAWVTLSDDAGRRVRLEWEKWQERNGRDLAVAFANALQDLKWYAAHGTAADDFADFRKRAEAWRALPQKPALNEEARRCQVLAENAVRRKELSEAVCYYEQGLAAEPLWHEAWYNAALLCGELQYNPDAADYARRYLELCPDAPEAEPLRKRIFVWEEDARKQGWAAAEPEGRGGAGSSADGKGSS